MKPGEAEQSLRQIVNVSDLQGRLIGKASELAILTGKDSDGAGERMDGTKVVEDQSPVSYSIRHGLLPAASNCHKQPVSSTAVPTKRQVKRATTFGLNVVPQTLTLRHGQALIQNTANASQAMQALKTVSTQAVNASKAKYHAVTVGS